MDSKLQIISGLYRGRKLFLPTGAARPTQNRARIALFNMLNSVLDNTENITVWDAFGGSGAFGIECLSRFPSARAIFTDVAPESIRAIRKNVGEHMASRAVIVHGDAIKNIAKYGAVVDVVFVDAPYALAHIGADFIRKLGMVAMSGAFVIWEQDAQNAVMPDDATWEIIRDKQYGRARFFIMQRR